MNLVWLKESEAKGLKSKNVFMQLTPVDYQSFFFYLNMAKRRKHYLILSAGYGGWTIVSVVPPKFFSAEKHTIAPKYHHIWLQSHIKPQTMFVVGSEWCVVAPPEEAKGGEDEQQRSASEATHRAEQQAGDPGKEPGASKNHARGLRKHQHRNRQGPADQPGPSAPQERK